jgi:hypothetical protein
MGIFSSILAPMLKTGAVIGASAIPGIGAIAGPVAAGLMQAGDSAMKGQGPLTSLSQGAIAGGISAGMGALNNALKPAEGAADTSAFSNELSITGNNPAFSQGYAGGLSVSPQMTGDLLTDWSISDIQKRMMSRYSLGGFGF